MQKIWIQSCQCTSESLLNYYIGEIVADDNTSQGKPLEYKTKITGKTLGQSLQPRNEGDTNQPAQPPVISVNVEVSIPIKCHSNFLGSLDLP